VQAASQLCCQTTRKQSDARAKLLFETEVSPNQSLNFGWPRIGRSREGRLWFATGSGLIGIDTHSWQAEKPSPQVHIESVLVNNRPLDPSLQAPVRLADSRIPIQLPANLSALEFQFTALSFEAPEKVRFRHKLDHFEPDWIETGPERHVNYGRLPSGRYEFHVTACNAEGVWNGPGAMLSFIIPTPLWRTSWALALYGFTAAVVWPARCAWCLIAGSGGALSASNSSRRWSGSESVSLRICMMKSVRNSLKFPSLANWQKARLTELEWCRTKSIR